MAGASWSRWHRGHARPPCTHPPTLSTEPVTGQQEWLRLCARPLGPVLGVEGHLHLLPEPWRVSAHCRLEARGAFAGKAIPEHRNCRHKAPKGTGVEVVLPHHPVKLAHCTAFPEHVPGTPASLFTHWAPWGSAREGSRQGGTSTHSPAAPGAEAQPRVLVWGVRF